jgi:hypothetical protein
MEKPGTVHPVPGFARLRLTHLYPAVLAVKNIFHDANDANDAKIPDFWDRRLSRG